MFGQQFTRLTDEEWLGYAHRSFKIEQHRLVPNYDAQLAKTMEGVDFGQPLAELWPAFDSLGRVPLLVLLMAAIACFAVSGMVVQILAMNIEKAHNLREKSIEVVRMYEELYKLEKDRKERREKKRRKEREEKRERGEKLEFFLSLLYLSFLGLKENVKRRNSV